ncbi:hypothetical protein Hte_000773 [Hypoxylon texense]
MSAEDPSKGSVPKEKSNYLQGQPNPEGSRTGPTMISLSRDQWTQQRAAQRQQEYTSEHSNNIETWMRHQDQEGPYHALSEVDARKPRGIPKESRKSEYATPSDATHGSSMQHNHESHGYKDDRRSGYQMSRGK